jgi:hypothetical protein
MLLDIMSNNCNISFLKIANQDAVQRILLIDEVDVFFSKEFFGNTYSP